MPDHPADRGWPTPRRQSKLAAGLLGGLLAAGLGLGAFAALVTVLWISSPYPDSGPGGALHVAAALWLLSHGVELIRTDTLSGDPAPVGLVPLLLVALPTVLLYRSACDHANAGFGTRARMTWVGLVIGYTAVGVAVTLYASGGALRPSWLWAPVCVPLLAALAAGTGMWTARGRPQLRLPASLGGAPETEWRRRLTSAAGRAAGAGVLVLVGGGALLVAVSLVWHGDTARGSFLQLTEGWSGRFAVLLLCVALVPNAAVWGAAYALGPGFVLGAGHAVGPLVTAAPAATMLPPLPLLAAVPGGALTPLTWGVGAVPLAAGVTVGCFTAARAAVEPGAPWSARRTTAATLLAAALCALAFAFLTLLAAGPLGLAALAHVGPLWWQTGGAAGAWMAAVAPPVALAARWWHVRQRKGSATGSATAPQKPRGEGKATTGGVFRGGREATKGGMFRRRKGATGPETDRAERTDMADRGRWFRGFRRKPGVASAGTLQDKREAAAFSSGIHQGEPGAAGLSAGVHQGESGVAVAGSGVLQGGAGAAAGLSSVAHQAESGAVTPGALPHEPGAAVPGSLPCEREASTGLGVAASREVFTDLPYTTDPPYTAEARADQPFTAGLFVGPSSLAGSPPPSAPASEPTSGTRPGPGLGAGPGPGVGHAIDPQEATGEAS
ncbi:DUF6350 family protein [Streptomyces tailanensis]|uniref:cell division protein PerM n=1 Tax=Streptomyces tailanensis TaxID=2569858 RepID=UPI003CCC7AD7